MKNYRSASVSAVLLLAMIFASCGSEPVSPPDDTVPTSELTTEDTAEEKNENKRSSVKDNLPDRACIRFYDSVHAWIDDSFHRS